MGSQGLIPAEGWTEQQLDAVLNQLCSVGFTAASNNSSTYKRLNLHRVPRRDALGMVRYHYYRRGMKGRLAGEPGSPQFMRSLIAKERQFATEHGQANPLLTAATSLVNEHKRATQTQPRTPSNTIHRVDSQLLTPEQLCARYQGLLTSSTLANWRAARPPRGPAFIRIGKLIFYPRRLVEVWELKNMVRCESPEVSIVTDREDEPVKT